MSSSKDPRTVEAIRCTWIGAILDTVLGVAKIIIGWLFHSHALIADGIHSLSDLLTDFMVVVIVKIAHAEPDKEHPYGHERFETLGTVALGFVLVAVAGAIAYESVAGLWNLEESPLPGWPTLVIAAISILSKEIIYRYTRAVGERIKSDLLIANAWHSRTDSFSSIVVFVGVAGAMMGMAWLDNLAAVGVALFVAKIGWDLIWKSLQELVDTAVEPEIIDGMCKLAEEVEGIEAIHSVKSRKMGQKKLLEMHLQVRPYVSASESHHLGDTVVAKIMQAYDDIGHIIFHIDTESDEAPVMTPVLPPRQEVTAIVDQLLAEQAPGLQRQNLVLHYLHGLIEMDLMVEPLPDSDLTAKTLDQQQLAKNLNLALQQQPWFKHLSLWYGL